MHYSHSSAIGWETNLQWCFVSEMPGFCQDDPDCPWERDGGRWREIKMERETVSCIHRIKLYLSTSLTTKSWIFDTAVDRPAGMPNNLLPGPSFPHRYIMNVLGRPQWWSIRLQIQMLQVQIPLCCTLLWIKTSANWIHFHLFTTLQVNGFYT